MNLTKVSVRLALLESEIADLRIREPFFDVARVDEELEALFDSLAKQRRASQAASIPDDLYEADCQPHAPGGPGA